MKNVLLLLMLFTISVAASDEAFYVTTGTGEILKYTGPNTYSVYASGLNGPSGLAMDNYGRLFEADQGTGRILEFTAPNTYTVYASGLINPAGMAIDRSGNLYVTNFSPSGTILKFTAPNTSTVYASNLYYPVAVALDSQQNLYVSKSAEVGSIGEILKFTAPNTSTVFGSNLNTPRNMAIDAYDRVYVTQDTSSGSVLQFTAPNISTVYASGLVNPFGVAVDKAGNLYVGDITSVHKYTAPDTSTIYASNLVYPNASLVSSAPQVQQVNRTPFASLTTLNTVSNAQLGVYGVLGFTYSSNGSSNLVDTNKPTIVLTHGFLSKPDTFNNLASSLYANNPNVNILAWDWRSDAFALKPGTAESRTPNEGAALGRALATALGSNYNQPIQFIGHSLGTLVDARAAEVFRTLVTGSSAATTQITLLDEAEVANLPIVGGTGNSVWNRSIPNVGLPGKPSDPIAGRIDNYISTFANIHTEAATNVILQKSPLQDFAYLFHHYPIGWYQETVDNPTTAQAGYQYSIVNPSSVAPTPGSYFSQTERTTFGPDLALTPITQQQAQSEIYFRELSKSVSPEGVASALTVGLLKTLTLGADLLNNTIQIAGHAVISSPLHVDPNTQLIIAGLTIELQKHSPSYVWLPITIPIAAQTMQFDLQFSNISPGDWLSAGINDTLLFALESQYVGNGINATSSLIDVTPWAGQSIDLLFGLNNVDDLNVGGTITVQNIQFQVAVPEPSRVLLLLIGCTGLLMRRRRA